MQVRKREIEEENVMINELSKHCFHPFLPNPITCALHCQLFGPQLLLDSSAPPTCTCNNVNNTTLFISRFA